MLSGGRYRYTNNHGSLAREKERDTGDGKKQGHDHYRVYHALDRTGQEGQQMNDQKIFVGSGKDFHFANGGQSLGLTIDLDALLDAYKQYGFDYNGKRYIKLKAVQKREPDQHGKTHYIEVDTYKPNQQAAPPQNGHNQGGSMAQGYNPQQNPQGFESYTPPSQPAQGYDDDIPF